MPVELTETPSSDPVLVPAGGDPIAHGRAMIVAAFQATINRIRRLDLAVRDRVTDRELTISPSAFQPMVTGSDDIRVDYLVAPTWDSAFEGSALIAPSGVTRYAMVDLAGMLPGGPSEVRLLNAKGAIFGGTTGCTVRLILLRRAGDTGAVHDGWLGQIPVIAAPAAPTAAFDVDTPFEEWIPYEPGDRLELWYRHETGGTGSATLGSVRLEVRAT